MIGTDFNSIQRKISKSQKMIKFHSKAQKSRTEESSCRVEYDHMNRSFNINIIRGELRWNDPLVRAYKGINEG